FRGCGFQDAVDAMTRSTGQQRDSGQALLKLFRNARRLHMALAFVLSFALTIPVAFGLGHEGSANPASGTGFAVICTADGITRVALDGEVDHRPGTHCACPFSCTISCCASNAASRDHFIGLIRRENFHKHLFSLQIPTLPTGTLIAETQAIRAPPAF
ncbi:MAG: hypothetical protein K8F25_02250, partial [Fimbriimonadaceae bacterium]|nr:hypothetical protein [Alphaproteobacteria bacterium]